MLAVHVFIGSADWTEKPAQAHIKEIVFALLDLIKIWWNLGGPVVDQVNENYSKLQKEGMMYDFDLLNIKPVDKHYII